MKVRTMRGAVIDMGRFVAQNEQAVAVGNAKMNARGDIVENGRVVKRREQVVQEYYAANPKAVQRVAISDLQNEIFTPQQAVAKALEALEATDAPAAPKSKRKIVEND